MRRLSAELIDQLDLERALTDELDTWRNQIPPEPWTSPVRLKATETVAWVRARLAAGAEGIPSVVVNARKATIGTRPVPVLGIADRVAYRALAKLALGDLALPDRSPDAYKAFIHGPIEYGFRDRQGPVWNIHAVDVKYVVEADIPAFYQYIDHDFLRHELELHTGRIESIDALVELLAETEGRVFGLPQLRDASDWLSDIYIQAVERELLRRGMAVWRCGGTTMTSASHVVRTSKPWIQSSDLKRRRGRLGSRSAITRRTRLRSPRTSSGRPVATSARS